MRALFLLTVARLAIASGPPAPTGVITVQSSQTLSSNVPADPAAGMTLIGMAGYRVTLCAAAGQTLSGAGSLFAYTWMAGLQLWARVPVLDLPVVATNARCESFGDLETFVPFARVFYGAEGVTVSGGTNVLVVMEGAQR